MTCKTWKIRQRQHCVAERDQYAREIELPRDVPEERGVDPPGVTGVDEDLGPLESPRELGRHQRVAELRLAVVQPRIVLLRVIDGVAEVLRPDGLHAALVRHILRLARQHDHARRGGGL